MERYEGVKFITNCRGNDFIVDDGLEELHYWVNLQAELGLAPVHNEGAYGNHSYRYDKDSFVITKTGMKPELALDAQDYCLVSYDSQEDGFNYYGTSKPSSECFLHFLIYERFSEINCVMHGHSLPLNRYGLEMNIPVTNHEYPYGTRELANAALEILEKEDDLILLKNHGFVAVGDSIGEAGRRILRGCGDMVTYLTELSQKNSYYR